MPKQQKKTGKGRLDKYYKLAKEQGYRARSAFKLIQLNKKYSFLESAKCCIDLCAAPGGWLQVASKYMPANSIIVGVDLVPIRPIPRVITHAADITTAQCRALLSNDLKDWKADVVLHDGAPNVGTAWVQDAYSQSELVLMSLKLAVQFLVKGGTFVTKVFRSADYNNLVWVFNQLFGKVEATKPPSSRNVSAEIFVVCRDFLAPKSIDPKFLDPKHVFKELSVLPGTTDKGTSANNVQANVFHPEKKRRARDGYAEGDYTLFKTAKAEDFIKGADAVGLLGTVNKISFESEEEKRWLSLDCTTQDIKANCADLKVLGKGDFKALLRWRTTIREEIGLESKTKQTEEFTEKVEIIEEVDEEEQIQGELERLNAEAQGRRKRERRRANELKTRAIQRMQLQMTAPMDIGLEQEDATLRGVPQGEIFDLGEAEGRRTKKAKDNGLVELGEDMEEDSEDEEPIGVPRVGAGQATSDIEDDAKVDRLELEMDSLYTAYRDRMSERDSKFRAKEARAKNKELEEWHGIAQKGSGSDSEDEDSSGEEGGWDKMQEAKQQDASSDDESASEDDEDADTSAPRGIKRRREDTDAPNKRPRRLVTDLERPEENHLSRAAQVWFDQDLFKGLDDELEELASAEKRGEDEGEETDEKTVHSMNGGNRGHGSNQPEPWSASEDDENDFEIVPQEPDLDEGDTWDVADANEDDQKEKHIQKYGLLTPEALTLASALVNRTQTRTSLINDGFNRHTFTAGDKDGLPTWFLDDEQKHYKANLPITKEAVSILRARQRALDARPIKKVAEAKARKKYRAVQRLEKTLKKAQGLSETTEMSEREKAAEIEKLMRKGSAKGKPKRDEVKVVVAKGVRKGLKGRPQGVKGRYLMVDSRGKKELRAKKRIEKAHKPKRR